MILWFTKYDDKSRDLDDTKSQCPIHFSLLYKTETMKL